MATSLVSRAAPAAPLKVGVIGHTGRGNYGHGLDRVWLRIPSTRIVAVADPVEKGRKDCLKRLGVENGYADYRLMLQREKPDLVAVGPRHADQHRDMMLAAIQQGVKGLYVEKPFVRTLAEADEVIAAATAKQVKIAVAHRNRYHPALQTVKTLLADGAIGEVLEVRARGKCDRRGGGEDLWVLGSHLFNMLAFLFGNPQRCAASMLKDGKLVAPADVIEGAEGLGPLAGNELRAKYQLGDGTWATFDSKAKDGSSGYAMQIVGSKGAIHVMVDRTPLAYFVAGNPFLPEKADRNWVPISSKGIGEKEPLTQIGEEVATHQTAAEDLVAAVRGNRSPLCDADEGRWTLEFILGAFASHVQGGGMIELPLENRENPLANWK